MIPARARDPRTYVLGGRSVDIWAIDLSASDAATVALASVLSPEEAERAARLRMEHLRRRFIAAHGAFRLLLGAYLRVDGSQVRLAAGPHGKPELDMDTDLKFNLSHSGEVALLGFTRNCEIGVDVEVVRATRDMASIAKRFFSPLEVIELMSLASPEQDLAFLRCWTRKEAYLKATGKGLQQPLDSFAVNLRPGEPPRIVHIRNRAEAAHAWTLHDIGSLPRYVGALAYQDSPRPVRILPLIAAPELLQFGPRCAGHSPRSQS